MLSKLGHGLEIRAWCRDQSMVSKLGHGIEIRALVSKLGHGVEIRAWCRNQGMVQKLGHGVEIRAQHATLIDTQTVIDVYNQAFKRSFAGIIYRTYSWQICFITKQNDIEQNQFRISFVLRIKAFLNSLNYALYNLGPISPICW